MKKALLMLSGAALILGMSSFMPIKTKKPATTLTVNAEKSRIDWVAAKKTDFHTGYFPIKSGTVNVEDGKITGGKFVIDLANLKVTDPGGGDGLTGHLKRADFFDVEKFNEAVYEISSVNYTSDATADISGNLTLKGVSFPVKIAAQVRGAGAQGLFAQSFVNLDRTLIGITYGVGNVAKDVQLAIHLFAK
ncbi:MAG: YceI family protein [Chitinophagaceae bacterium]|nr:YceI family protein [Chitinophagaceae bacterium]